MVQIKSDNACIMLNLYPHMITTVTYILTDEEGSPILFQGSVDLSVISNKTKLGMNKKRRQILKNKQNIRKSHALFR